MDTTARAWIEANRGDLEEEIIRICEIPAPTFHEAARADHVRARLSAAGFEVEQDPTGNLTVTHAGGSPGPTTLLVAHLDTVFGADTDVRVRREGGRLLAPGIGDDSAGVGALITLARLLRETGFRFPGELILAFSVGEEGLGDLLGMRALMDRLAARLDQVVAIDFQLDEVVARAVGSRRYRIQVTAPGGHSWSDFGRPSAVHLLAGAVTRLTSISLPAEPRTSFNVGTFHGGTGVNAIARDAEILVDLRSTDEPALADLEQRMLAVLGAWAEEVHRLPDCRVGWEVVGDRPAGAPGDGRVADTLRQVADALGQAVRLTAASTDASIAMSRGLPAACLGVYRGGGSHTSDEWLDADSLGPGLVWLYEAFMALQRLSPRRDRPSRAH